MHAGGLLRLREPSVAQRRTDLLPLQFRTLPAQIPGKDSDPQQQDKQQGYRQGRRLAMHSVAQQNTQCLPGRRSRIRRTLATPRDFSYHFLSLCLLRDSRTKITIASPAKTPIATIELN